MKISRKNITNNLKNYYLFIVCRILADGRVMAGNRYRVRVAEISSTKDILLDVFYKIGGIIQTAVALLGIQETNGHDAISLIESLARG